MQAVTAFLLLQRQGSEMHEVMSWLMGSLADKEWAHVLVLLPYTLIGTALALLHGRELNILALGDETAHHLGVSLERTQLLLLLLASLLAAAAVAVSGIIAFVGLIVPHLMRLLVGPNHRVLLPACLLCGGLLLHLGGRARAHPAAGRRIAHRHRHQRARRAILPLSAPPARGEDVLGDCLRAFNAQYY